MPQLTEADVTFTVAIEPEDIPIADQFDDPQTVAEITAAHNAGSLPAWCCLVVTATWVDPDGNEHSASDYLGGCSFLEGIREPIKSQIAACVEDHGMKGQALTTLQQDLDAIADRERPIVLRSEGARQARKEDLVDIGRAIGAKVSDGMSLDKLRTLIVAHLNQLNRNGRINPIR